jgi:hypothetical protein
MRSFAMQTSDAVSVNGAAPRAEELAAQLAKMKQEFGEVKAEVDLLRTKCSQMYKVLLMLCCPKEWYTEQIDEKELEDAKAHAHEQPSIQELIEELAKSDTLSDVQPV